MRTLVRRLAKSASGPRRQLVGIDSNVVVGCLSKGRSSSRDLNRVLRTFLPEQVFADIYLGVLGVPTKQNPADAPSRRRATRRAAVAAPPLWAVRFVDGEVDAVSSVLPPDARFEWLPGVHERSEDARSASDEGPATTRRAWSRLLIRMVIARPRSSTARRGILARDRVQRASHDLMPTFCQGRKSAERRRPSASA